MKVVLSLAACAALTLVPSAVAVSASAPAPAAPSAQSASAAAAGHVAIVQAVPGASVDVAIDGENVESGVAAGEVLGPYPLSPGSHQVDFTGSDGLEQVATLEVEAGSNQDLVLHLPASVGGAAVVTSYSTPEEPIGPDKARVLVAHTATVAPADVKVDGKVVFANIANGEFATADVPAGEHVVALLPTGQDTDPILGPLTVDARAADRHDGLRHGQPRRRLDEPGRALGRPGRRRQRGAVDDRHRVGGSGRRCQRHPVRGLDPPEGGGESMAGKRVRRRARRRTAPILAAVVLVAAGLTWTAASLDRGDEPDIGARDESGRSSAPTTEPTGAHPRRPRPRPPAGPATPAQRTGTTPEAPREIRLPSGETLPVRSVSTRPDGLLDVPDDVRTAGWWRGGSRLGDPFGATLIAAHIDSETQGLGPYVELLRVERNDEITVRSAHLVQHFRVTSLRLVPRTLPGRRDGHLLGVGSPPARDGHLRRAVRPRPRRLPEPRHRDGPPRDRPTTEVVLVKRTPRPSSRQAYPLRMPPRTYWRPPEPAEEVIGYAMPADPETLDPETLDEKPEVTSPEWVAWVEHELVQSRARARRPLRRSRKRRLSARVPPVRVDGGVRLLATRAGAGGRACRTASAYGADPAPGRSRCRGRPRSGGGRVVVEPG